jgi:hypothetical protein
VEIQVKVLQVENGIIKVEQNGQEETLYLSRFARFDWLPKPGETVILKLDKRNFVREIRRPQSPVQVADELTRAIMGHVQDMTAGSTRDRLHDPDFLLAVFRAAAEVVGQREEEDDDEESVFYWADLILNWIRERAGEAE